MCSAGPYQFQRRANLRPRLKWHLQTSHTNRQLHRERPAPFPPTTTGRPPSLPFPARPWRLRAAANPLALSPKTRH